ncbi:hypothetical protein AFLA70_136g001871 [Aspergillus flavus AF70]|nr:hypothetical protein AFLA70_136g001871 [Aspergillus flavus AF70]
MAGWGFPTAIKGLQYLFAGHDLGSGIKAISKFSMLSNSHLAGPSLSASQMCSPSRVCLFGKVTPSVRGTKRLVQRDATRSQCALVHYVIPHIPSRGISSGHIKRNSGTEIPSPCVTALARLDLGLGDASDNDILVWIFFKLLTVI